MRFLHPDCNGGQAGSARPDEQRKSNPDTKQRQDFTTPRPGMVDPRSAREGGTMDMGPIGQGLQPPAAPGAPAEQTTEDQAQDWRRAGGDEPDQPATPGPSAGSVDVAHGQMQNQPGDTAPRRNGGQGPDAPKSLGSAGGGSTGPGSSTIHEPPER